MITRKWWTKSWKPGPQETQRTGGGHMTQSLTVSPVSVRADPDDFPLRDNAATTPLTTPKKCAAWNWAPNSAMLKTPAMMTEVAVAWPLRAEWAHFKTAATINPLPVPNSAPSII
jgi:hypothetical protein